LINSVSVKFDPLLITKEKNEEKLEQFDYKFIREIIDLKHHQQILKKCKRLLLLTKQNVM
jgi:hypothetical protein